MNEGWNTIPRHKGSYFDETPLTVPRDPQPPSQGTVFRRRLEQLRMELGVRCETCEFFEATDSLHRCTLKMDWTGRSDWCESWQEKS